MEEYVLDVRAISGYATALADPFVHYESMYDYRSSSMLKSVRFWRILIHIEYLKQ